jgi:hypothetical protein
MRMAGLVRVHLSYGVERVRIPRITDHTLLNRLQIAPSLPSSSSLLLT